MIDFRWRNGQQAGNEFVRASKNFRELEIFFRIVLRERGDALGGFGGARIQEESAGVWRWREDAAFRFEPLHAVALELHVLRDRWCERTGRAIENRSAKAGMKFLGDGGATDDGAAFENERLETGARQIKCGDEAVVARSDDDDVTRAHK